MRYPLLDVLRGIAALWVFAHHMVYTVDGSVAPDLLRLGYFGVPMFFVISGFCLAAAGRRAVRASDAPERFLLRRAVRIYPPFWAAVGVAVAVYAVLPLVGPPLTGFEERSRLAWRAAGPGEWLQVATLTAGFRPTGELPWDKYGAVNLAFWTLAIEVQFYAVVWVAVRAGARFYPVLGAVTVVALPFGASAAAFSSGWFLPFWPFFALGVGLYAALEGWGQVRPGFGRVLVWLTGAGLMAVGLAVAPVAPDGGRAMVAGEFVFAVGLTALLWAHWRPEERGAPGGVWGYLGSTSYSVYLLHLPLMLLVGHAVAVVVPPGSLAFLAITLVGVCALVYPFHRYVERPCIGAGRSARAVEPSPETCCIGASVPP